MGNDMELKKKKKKQDVNSRSSKLLESGENVNKMVEGNKENKSSGKKKRKREKVNQVDAEEDVKFSMEEDKSIGKEMKRKRNKSSRKKNRQNEEQNRVVLGKVDGAEGKSKSAAKNKEKVSKSSEKQVATEPDQVYHISSGDEGCSKGMRKWIMEYHNSRPGLNILQQRIDEFITAYEAEQEQARKEREAKASEEGWTVVTHHKGRKKTTDSESGIAVGSVAQAAVMDKMAKKKSKEIAVNFYRFQKREQQKNELMMLRSKFEQDKKRIQQLRAARKFRPY